VLATTLASRLRTLPAATTQVIIVHAPSYSGTYATLETFTKVNGVWRQQFLPMAARIGSKGFSDNHTEGVPTTPTGVYGFSDTMYGIDPNPGVRYAYHRIVADDWWNENPDSPDYNTFQHTAVNPGGASEALWKETVAYCHFAVIRYNIPVTGYARGSGIFLHVGTGGPTAGCVSLSQSDLVRVLTWLDPAKSPRIVLSPDSALSRY
jgi:L,D-peptidoglycan transpeptidase YkuD (ErfK/YbiS/YcfS/YnhG family)